MHTTSQAFAGYSAFFVECANYLVLAETHESPGIVRLTHPGRDIYFAVSRPPSGRTCRKTSLSEKPQQITHQQDQQYCAKSYACSSTDAPSAVSVVSAASAEYEDQNNNENDQHLQLLRSGHSRIMSLTESRRATIRRKFHRRVCCLNLHRFRPVLRNLFRMF